jgi:hypothetical protein
MTQPTLRSIALSLLLFTFGCDGQETSDAGVDASSDMDGSLLSDASPLPDASNSGECTPVTVQNWRLDFEDDVSIVYRARITPNLGAEPWDLYLQFNRYDLEYVGEFPLGTGMERSYGSCARCVIAFYGTTVDHGFFADAGTLTVRTDPFDQRLDVTLSDVRLREVDIVGPTLESVPVANGRCLELADTVIDQNFPSAGWHCPADQFNDGVTCHCGCGAFDPDCDSQCPLPPEPSCDPTPLPIQGCGEGDLCTWDGECAETCQHEARVPCDSGVCGFSHEGDRCFNPAVERMDDAAVGEHCDPGERIYFCAVDTEGFAMGLCDVDSDWLCRATCDEDEDCTADGEICWGIFVDPASGRSQGFCAPAPAECIPTGETCSEHLDCCTVLCEGADPAGGVTGTCG